tara:strand:+ start:2437 stop:2799 length:363 start_codon:yes stop_codon:yes gene_type:complete
MSSYKKINIGRYPKTDQWCNEFGFTLSFALAGFCSKDVKVFVENNMLWVSTNKIEQDLPSKSKGFIHRGIAKRSFKKGYYLDKSLDINSVSATMKNGLLTIFVPFIEKQLEPVNIEVKSE